MKLEYSKHISTNSDVEEIIILKNGTKISIDEAVEDLNMLPKLIKMLSTVSEALMPPVDKQGFKRAISEQTELLQWFDKNQISSK